MIGLRRWGRFAGSHRAGREGEVPVILASDVARARRMTRIAREAGLGRESLYAARHPGSTVRYESVRTGMGVPGVMLTVSAGA
jgi:probable addiction module antidote protein